MNLLPKHHQDYAVLTLSDQDTSQPHDSPDQELFRKISKDFESLRAPAGLPALDVPESIG